MARRISPSPIPEQDQSIQLQFSFGEKVRSIPEHALWTSLPERGQAIIHDNGSGGRNIEGKCRWNAHEMLAPGGKLGRERSPFGSKHVGSL
jgi:hypothetical protein